ncbi:hypothetical protein B0H14DRAFT_2591700 [Mycena olivaceomarginata]|nr:hypothetical protein B0H14DRAFT_2591700 [Mycena olivaceomarginata]
MATGTRIREYGCLQVVPRVIDLTRDVCGQGSQVFKGRIGEGRRKEEVDQHCALRVCHADQGRGRVCVVCRGISRSGRGALQCRGRSVGKHVGGRWNTEQVEPVHKGNHRSDEGDPKLLEDPEAVQESELGNLWEFREPSGNAP